MSIHHTHNSPCSIPGSRDTLTILGWYQDMHTLHTCTITEAILIILGHGIQWHCQSIPGYSDHSRIVPGWAYVALLHVQKAFNTVLHNGLFQAFHLRSSGSFLSESEEVVWILMVCAVLWEGKQSQTLCIKQGVKQGAILSPLLYSLFVNDLLVNSGTIRAGCEYRQCVLWCSNVCRRSCSHCFIPS